MNNQAQYVRNLFSSIAPTYDFLNTFLSFNRDKRWRKKMVAIANVPENGTVLDLCTGTGKLAFAFHEQSPTKLVIGLDFSWEMIELANASISQIPNPKSQNKMIFIQADALSIPFASNSFDCVTIAFGLRNVTDLNQLFNDMLRVTKPGGKMLALELTRPENKFMYFIYYCYLHWYLPLMGRLISSNKTAYSYLTTTISHFYGRDQVKQFITDSGWKNVSHIPLTAGIVTIYIGTKVL